MKIVLVCTGNTCRSPMAEALLKDLISKRLNCSIQELSSKRSVTVISAAIQTHTGEPAAYEAIQVMQEQGLDITHHKTQNFTEEVAKDADLVLTMTDWHRQMVVRTWPQLEKRTFCLRKDGNDISDPIGGPIDTYRSTAGQIEQELAKWIPELELGLNS